MSCHTSPCILDWTKLQDGASLLSTRSQARITVLRFVGHDRKGGPEDSMKVHENSFAVMDVSHLLTKPPRSALKDIREWSAFSQGISKNKLSTCKAQKHSWMRPCACNLRVCVFDDRRSW